MKTKINMWKVLIIVGLFSVYTMSGSRVSAQSDPDQPESNELKMALSELEAFMIESENAIKYKAPSDEFDDIEMALERIETLADKFGKELKYQAPDFDILSDDVPEKEPVSREFLTQKKNSGKADSKNQSL